MDDAPAATAAPEWSERAGIDADGDDAISRSRSVLAALIRFSKPAAVFAVLVAMWQVIAAFAVVPSYVLASPLSLVHYIPENIGKLLDATAVTVQEMLLGYAIALGIGIGVGILITQSKFLEDSLLPLLVLTQVIPSIAIAPLLVLLMGFGLAPKVATAAIVAFFPILVNTTAGLRSQHEDLRNLSRILGASTLQHLRRFALPHAMPYIFAGARIGITLSVIGAVVGEFVTANAGLGYLVLQGTNAFDAEQVFATLIFLALTGILAFGAVRLVEHFAIPWASHREES